MKIKRKIHNYLKFILASETPYTQRYEISSSTRHPNYSSEKDINDIAVIKVKRAITFNAGVGPVCLPFKYKNRIFTCETFQISQFLYKIKIF